jgi:hypothetical protein
MPEIPVTREQLLASVLELKAGDVLLVRMVGSTAGSTAVKEFAQQLKERFDPLGVHVMVLYGDSIVGVEAVRPTDEMIAT